MTMDTMTEISEGELVREVEAAKRICPDARVKVRRGRVIVLSEDLIMLEPLGWAFRDQLIEADE
jgi:hypothetical protein